MELRAHIFKKKAIDWHRVGGEYQRFSVLLIVRRLLECEKVRFPGSVDEGIGKLSIGAPRGATAAHLYCSPNNAGASSLATELRVLLAGNAHGSSHTSSALLVSDQADELEDCEHFLLYLTSATWTSGETSERFADEIRRALHRGVHLVPVHEFQSMLEADTVRGACSFNDFWNEGWSNRYRAQTHDQQSPEPICSLA